MKTGTKLLIAVGAVTAVGAVLFGTPYSKGLLKNYWGVGTTPKQAASGTSGTLRPPPAATGSRLGGATEGPPPGWTGSWGYSN